VPARSSAVLTVFRPSRRQFGDKMMRRIIGPEGEKKRTGGGETYIAMIIIRVRHIIHMGSIKNAHKILVLKAEEELDL